jgi:hypothetical protein
MYIKSWRINSDFIIIVIGISVWLYFIFFILLEDCESVAKRFRPEKYDFTVEKKYKVERKSDKIEGRNKSGNREVFSDYDYFLYDSVQVGDRLVKKEGKLIVYLYRNGTETIFKYKGCGREHEME